MIGRFICWLLRKMGRKHAFYPVHPLGQRKPTARVCRRCGYTVAIKRRTLIGKGIK